MNEKNHVKTRLKSFDESDIVISDHALIRITQRQIKKSEIMKTF